MSDVFWFETGTPGKNPWLAVIRAVNSAHGYRDGACQFDHCLGVDTYAVNGSIERYPGAHVVHNGHGQTYIRPLTEDARAEIVAALAALGEEVK